MPGSDAPLQPLQRGTIPCQRCSGIAHLKMTAPDQNHRGGSIQIYECERCHRLMPITIAAGTGPQP
jgi:hypothetical protein